MSETNSEVKLEVNEKAVRQLLKSHEMKVGVGDIAQKIANRAGDGYEADIKYMGSRVIASAYTATIEARKDNAENQTLKKVVE